VANTVLQKLAKKQKVAQQISQEAQDRLDRIVNGATAVQQAFILDSSQYESLRVPRRGGKSFAMASKALYVGEKIPGARILIISLTLKSTKENFWSGPGGIKYQNNMYQLGLTYNETDTTWFHSNGSRGRLAGAETRADIEYLRGAAAEADIVLLDECKSFAPDLLAELIRDVIEPGLMTRDGTMVMGGTPGNIPEGEFYLATQPGIKIDPSNPKSNFTCYKFTGKPRTDDLWSLHTWTIADNTAKPKQWERALRVKAKNEINDQDPRWRREYLGEWVTDASELVYAFAKCKTAGKCIWNPERKNDNPCGLPAPINQWRLIMGLDFGYEDMNAIVIAAYSETQKELRHVYDFKQNHMTIDDFGVEIQHTIELYGTPDVIVGDKGSLGGVLYLQELQSRFGLSIIEAEKREKYDHIELLNSDFYTERVFVIRGSDLDHELCGLQWDLSKDSKARLTRLGRLKEDPGCANHLCDAFLYLWRYCYHYWSVREEVSLTPGTTEWYKERETVSIARMRAKKDMSNVDKELDNYQSMLYYDTYQLGDIYDFS
jgi:hypothetical protein